MLSSRADLRQSDEVKARIVLPLFSAIAVSSLCYARLQCPVEALTGYERHRSTEFRVVDRTEPRNEVAPPEDSSKFRLTRQSAFRSYGCRNTRSRPWRLGLKRRAEGLLRTVGLDSRSAPRHLRAFPG